MKPILQSCCWAAAALLAFSCDLSAATSERLLSITLTGVDQFVDQSTGDDVAIPFRITNRDILARITDATGTNVDNALLVVIDSLDDTNALTQIVARTASFEVDVTDFFPIDQGESVRTVKYAGNNFRGATYFAIDHFQFSAVVSSPGDTNGIDFILQGFTTEVQRVLTVNIGRVRTVVTSSTLKSDGNGELLDFSSTNRFVSPFKGTVKMGSARFFP